MPLAATLSHESLWLWVPAFAGTTTISLNPWLLPLGIRGDRAHRIAFAQQRARARHHNVALGHSLADFDLSAGRQPDLDPLGLDARAPHHLVSAVDALEHVDAATWAARAADAIREVRARGRRPIVCGGTFLWVKALLWGLAETPAGSAELRERHRALAEREGRAALHDALRAVDPESAARLHPNDLMRVSRALEVHELTGRPLSAWQAEHAFATARWPARLLAIACEPAALTERIRARAQEWLAGGRWEEEVRALLARGYGEARAMNSVGYAQVKAAVEGTLARDELETAVVRATRVFARRQRTWLNHADVTWVS